ncbi:DUF309 domain-containing protein [Sulfurospirillum arcachonense]|uniref:DUF309 domain-containing protein n=1 Tax=Sulfurospirillum arcachonense TaxID=57666 RepID=UPI0004683BFA|nr:DUF309 domain-containing protein [Sulfurospirillum arcachonense]
MRELENFLKVVYNNDFVEGHEVLEDKWREWKNIPKKREESFILKGLINGSTALALKVMKRTDPANQVWETFLKYSSLIDKIDSNYTLLYKEARELLHVKYKEFF